MGIICSKQQLKLRVSYVQYTTWIINIVILSRPLQEDKEEGDEDLFEEGMVIMDTDSEEEEDDMD